MTTRFQNNVIDKKVAEAIKDAEKILAANSPLYKELINKHDWKYNSGTSEEICVKLCLAKEPLKVFTYRHWNPWSNVIGYFDNKDSIFINLRKLPSMSHKDVVANLVHEYSHYSGFTHGSNYPSRDKNLYSVPYYLSENVSKWL